MQKNIFFFFLSLLCTQFNFSFFISFYLLCLCFGFLCGYEIKTSDGGVALHMYSVIRCLLFLYVDRTLRARVEPHYAHKKASGEWWIHEVPTEGSVVGGGIVAWDSCGWLYMALCFIMFRNREDRRQKSSNRTNVDVFVCFWPSNHRLDNSYRSNASISITE